MLYGLLSCAVPFKPEKDIPDLDGKVIFITGGNVGLGKQTILQLSQHNPKRIYLAARTESKALSAIKDLQASVPGAPITYIHCDLTSLPSVAACAAEFVSKEDKLDMLFCNAGIMAVPPGQTEQGYEIQFGTNHVGHALLTKLLLPTLLKTAEEGRDVRVVALSSIGHVLAPSNGISFSDLKTDISSWSTMRRYGQSKLANILFIKELARRYPSLTAVAVHPGVVNTELYNTVYSGWMGLGGLMDAGRKCLYASVEDGAKNQIWAAVAGKGKGKREVRSGEYYTPVGVSGQGTRHAGDGKLAERLWEWTEGELEAYKVGAKL